MFGGYRDRSTINGINYNKGYYDIAEDRDRCIPFSEEENWELETPKPIETKVVKCRMTKDTIEEMENKFKNTSVDIKNGNDCYLIVQN